MRRLLSLMIAVLAILALAVPATAANQRGGNGSSPIVPDHIWVDGRAHDTIILGSLPWSPENDHSFNDLYPVLNVDGTAAQGPVAAYAPTDPEYRGGRWVPEPVQWTQAAVDAGAVETIESINELHALVDAGFLEELGRNTDAAFLCPVLTNS